MQLNQTNTHSSISVVQREKFITDPFFLTVRQILETNLLQLSHEISTTQSGLSPLSYPVAASAGHPLHCCCANQAFERLGEWAPAILIPCLSCSPDQADLTNCQVRAIQNSSIATTPADAEVVFTQDNCHLVLDVHDFQPHEINVCVEDDYIDVTAQHDQMAQMNTHLAIRKRYKMPYRLNISTVQCSLSRDGILFLIAPWLKT